MSDSLNVYLNTVGTNNIFVPSQTYQATEESVEDYNFVSKTYNPTIESTDEDGEVEIEEKQEEEKEPSALQNVWSGTKEIVGGSTKGVFGMIGDVVKGCWSSTGTVLSGSAKSLVGGLQVISTPVVGLVKGVGYCFNNSVNGIKQIFKGNIFKGFGSILKGATGFVTQPLKWLGSGVKKIAQGTAKAVKGLAKGVASVGKAIGKGIANVGKAIGKGIKKIFKGW